jgi:hypothetical protein
VMKTNRKTKICCEGRSPTSSSFTWLRTPPVTGSSGDGHELEPCHALGCPMRPSAALPIQESARATTDSVKAVTVPAFDHYEVL